MWQVLLAAAVAGSTGFVAKHFLNPNPDPTKTHECDPGQSQHEETPEPSTPRATISAPFHYPGARDSANASDRETSREKIDEVFKFSSSGSSGDRSSSKNRRKKSGKGLCKSPCVSQGSGVGGSGRKFHVCLKKRKTGKNFPPKCGSCSSKDTSSFNYGLGVGIMYMISAGKAEISRLNTAMEETAKVVKELKTELDRRKSSQNVKNLSSVRGFNANPRSRTDNCLLEYMPRMDNQELNDVHVSGLPPADDGEYASSVLTEERERELMEINQMEAELELELQKLPWSVEDSSCQLKPYLSETEVPCGFLHKAGDKVPDFSEFNGVLPTELHQKLSHLLIEQQESQITELETELHSTQSKLREKDAELQGLKDCVRRLSQFSLSTGSDDEMEAHDGEEWTGNWDDTGNIGSELKTPVVGTKRPIGSES